MARAHFVKAARKDNPVAKKGESYYWWAFMVGGRGGPKHFSKDKPRRSQLTSSEYLGALYDIQDNAGNHSPSVDSLKEDIENIVSDLENLRDEAQERFDNIPESLQQAEVGQTLENRISSVEDAISELENIDTESDDIDVAQEDKQDVLESWLNDRWSEVNDALSLIEE